MSKLFRHYWNPVKRERLQDGTFVVTDQCYRCSTTRQRIRNKEGWSVRYKAETSGTKFATMCPGPSKISVPLNPTKPRLSRTEMYDHQ